MTSEDFLHLSQCKLFRGLIDRQLHDALRQVKLSIESYSPGALIRSRGDCCDALLILLAGKVSGQFQEYDGRVLRVETIAAPEMIASAFLFAPEPRFPVNILAVDRVRMCLIPRESVITLAQSSRQIMSSLLEDMASRTAFLAEKLRLTEFATLRQKVAGYLLERSDNGARGVITLPMNQTTLAELFGVARPSLGRVLHELEQSGVIARERRSIRILDSGALTGLLLETE